MSRKHLISPRLGGICGNCESDLETRLDGKDKDGHQVAGVFCTNPVCKYHRKPHPTPKDPNIPKRFAGG